MNNNILERLRHADPLAGELPPQRPLPRSLAAPQAIADRRRRRPLRHLAIVAAATICMVAAASALVDTPDRASDRNSTAGADERTARPAENNIDTGAGGAAQPAPPKMSSPHIPPVPRVPPTGSTIRFAPVDSGVSGTLRLPASASEQAHFRLGGLRHRTGREYGVWLLGNSGNAKFLGYVVAGERADNLARLPDEWQRYAAVVVTVERPRRRPTQPGATVAKAILP